MEKTIDIESLVIEHKSNPNDVDLANQLAKARHNLYLLNNENHKNLKNETANNLANRQDFENLVFQGGGIKGIAYVGALEKLFTSYINKASIKRVAGTSAGAIIAVLLGVGYSVEEIKILLQETEFTEFMDGDYNKILFDLLKRENQIKEEVQDGIKNLQKIMGFFRNPFKASHGATAISKKAFFSNDVKAFKEAISLLNDQNFGLFPGNYFLDWIEFLIQKKTGIAYLTFKELHDLIKKSELQEDFKDIYIAGTNLSTGQIEVFSHETCDGNIIISDALRISMSIPLVFSPHGLFLKEKNYRVQDKNQHLYIDGGVLDNYPLWIFDRLKSENDENNFILSNPKTLGLRLVPEEVKNYYEGNNVEIKSKNPETLMQYIWKTIEVIYEKQESDHNKIFDKARTIYIDHLKVSTTQFNLDKNTQDNLMQKGIEAVNDFFTKRTYQLSYIISAVKANDLLRIAQAKIFGYELNVRDSEGNYLLDIALLENNKHMVVNLLELGAYECQNILLVEQILNDILEKYTEFFDKNQISCLLESFKDKQTKISNNLNVIPKI